MWKAFVFGLALLPTCAAVGQSPAEHPLIAVLQRAEEGHQRMDEEIHDYCCVLTKRERIQGQLRGPESFFLKVRHERSHGGMIVEPFSVYLRFLRPESVKDREVIYVRGHNDDKIIVRNGGKRFAYVTTALPPDSPAVLQQSRYPLTEIGVQTLTRRLIEVGQQELQEADCDVQVLPGAKINGRPCSLIQVAHREQQSSQTWQYVRIFIDDQLELPVYYAAYDWPVKADGKSVLLEEYVYTDIQLNVGLTDWDFDHRNENYLFLKSFEP